MIELGETALELSLIKLEKLHHCDFHLAKYSFIYGFNVSIIDRIIFSLAGGAHFAHFRKI